jgi:hypothetical protein
MSLKQIESFHGENCSLWLSLLSNSSHYFNKLLEFKMMFKTHAEIKMKGLENLFNLDVQDVAY